MDIVVPEVLYGTEPWYHRAYRYATSPLGQKVIKGAYRAYSERKARTPTPTPRPKVPIFAPIRPKRMPYRRTYRNRVNRRIYRKKRPGYSYKAPVKKRYNGKRVVQLYQKRKTNPLTVNRMLDWRKTVEVVEADFNHDDVTVNRLLITCNTPAVTSATNLLSGTTTSYTLDTNTLKNYSSSAPVSKSRVMMRGVYISGFVKSDAVAGQDYWLTLEVLRPKHEDASANLHFNTDCLSPDAFVKTDFDVLYKKNFKPIQGSWYSGTAQSADGAKVETFAFNLPMNRWVYTKDNELAVADADWDLTNDRKVWLRVYPTKLEAGTQTVGHGSWAIKCYIKKTWGQLPFDVSQE